jgi:cytochrome c oxidase subunit II
MSKNKHSKRGQNVKTRVFPVFVFVLFTLAAQCVPAHAQQPIIEIHAKRFEFVPAEITVKKGQTVTLSLISDDAPHSLLIEGVGVNAAIARGHATQVQITPAKAGDFKGRCGRFCGSGHGRMTFVLHVTE